MVFPPGRPSPPRKSFAFPRCLAFARSSSRNKETLASRLAYGSADPSRPPRKSSAFPRCLAFAKLDTRNKETLASRLAYGSADPSRPPRKSSAFPRCLAFAKLDTRNKETLASKLAAPPYYSCSAWTQCSSMFSIKIPYPFVESWMNTWVTAPMSLPSWMMGLPVMPCTMPPVSFRSSSFTTRITIPLFF